MKPRVLLFNLKETEKGKNLERIFTFLKYQVFYPVKDDYDYTLGELSGLDEIQKERIYTGEDFQEELMVLYTETEDQLNQALFFMREEKVTVDLKAMITPTNRKWKILDLYKEIKEEHEYMKKMKEEGK
ncbi:hypothetical protein M2454_001800 [Aequitasia blattaphilus]|uniref:DUF3783 domain-containing protein n=1 Tax=Aequitasia blattaphilus TaxID=2949332 RepID=A0ABT1E9G1_9FIRM|nr:DUF3783 domain-containing protein [Aequitasia blattaphilus]MCP1102326.1 DUF3783 domain-containing protein [Aequitasia blattaphilus]MCR8614966.1 DUF3783 domain-containing protein [Aequitasia blattaphilus]